MIRHLVSFSLNPETIPAPAQDHLTQIKEQLEALPEQIPQLVSLEVDINRNPAEAPAFILNAVTQNYQDLAAYAAHPAHVAVVKALIAPYKTARVCIDSEF